MDIRQFEDIARMVHMQNYRLCGDRYCTDKELEMHLSDPLACYELVKDEMIVLTGLRLYTRHCIEPADTDEMVRAMESVIQHMRYTVERFPARRYDKGG